MAKVDALAQLKDIHLPPPVGYWPLAPGWYVLMAILFLLSFSLALVLYKRHLRALPKKRALALLDVYSAEYKKEANAQRTSAHISELLKRVALVYYPRSQVASIYGDAWIEFLNQTSKGIDFNSVKPLLLDAPFKSTQGVNLEPLIACAAQWIKQRKVPCLN